MFPLVDSGKFQEKKKPHTGMKMGSILAQAIYFILKSREVAIAK